MQRRLQIMNGQVPTYIENVIEKRLGHGLGLEELAVFAATMSDLIYREVLHDLEHVYEVLGVATTSLASEENFSSVVKMTLVARVDGVEEGGNTVADYQNSEEHLIENFWAWDDVRMWAEDFHKTYDRFHQSRNPFLKGYDFDYVVRYMQELTLKYGHLQAMDCRAHKNQLMDLEMKGTGRVPLTKFYSGMGDEDWPFVEKESYLRSLGALDETDPKRPSVVIPNYLNGLSNCLTPSAFYSVCCVNECEGLMSHVEKAIAAPEGEPARILDFVSKLASDTVEAPRNLSAVQTARLHEIAQHHAGLVPLHGRLFAQWMHHAFPRECEFPHVSGTTSPEIPDDWNHRTGSDIYANDHEIRKYLINSDSEAPALHADALPWNAVEELVGSHKLAPASREGSRTSKPMRAVLLLVVFASAFWPMVRSSKAASAQSPVVELEKQYV